MANISSVKLPDNSEYNFEDVVSAKGSQPNLLINPWFTINQRGFTSATAPMGVYTCDRWYAMKTEGSTATVTVNSSGVTLSGQSIVLRQFFEDIPAAGRTVTLSVLLQDGTIKSSTGTSPTSKPAANTDYIVVSLTNGTVSYAYNANKDALMVQVFNNTSGSTAVKAVKLEIGSTSTLHLDTEPDYTTELLKCQRYFVRIQARGTAKSLYTGVGLDTSLVGTVVTLATPLRTQPTIAYANFELRDLTTATNISITNITVGGDTFLDRPTMICTGSGITAGRSYIIRSAASTAYIDFNAEL